MATRFQSKRSRSFVLFLSLLVLLTGAFAVSAQQAPAPIAIGENKTGTLSAAQPVVTFALLVDQPQTLTIRVFAVSPGLAPTARLLDTNGNQLGAAANNGSQTAVQIANVNATLGVYRIEVSSANGQLGDFLVNVQGEQQQPPIALPTGQIVNGTVSSAATRLNYSFSGSGDQGRWLFVQSLLPTSGPIVTVFDATTQEELASSSARMRGIRLQIPAGATNYRVEVSYGGAPANEAFLICLALENNPASCPVTGNTGTVIQQVTSIPPTDVPAPTLLPTQLPPLPPSNVCILASATGGNVNVRVGPSTTFPVVTQLNGSTIANVIGRLPDNSWYLIQVGGISGWISGTVVRLGGPCQLSPFITPTPIPTIAGPTLTPTPTLTATVTATATNTTAPLTLNPGASPNYGTASLTAGFVPDPFTQGITSGGSVNVNYLGGGCTGFATQSPDFRVNYTAGGATLLRFYFIGSGDTTLIVQAPGGGFFCNDDSFGTLNPTVDFNSPASGTYNIWVGSFSSGTFISGTLNVTELSGNHP